MINNSGEMKLKFCSTRLLFVILSLIIASGCSSGRKTAGSEMKAKKNDLVYHENNGITDPNTGIAWSYYDDNPTTYYRVKLNDSEKLPRLPAADQLNDLLSKVAGQLSSKKDPGDIKALFWFDTDCDFLTSKSTRTDNGEILYEVVRWNAMSKTFKGSSVTGGDLVVVLLIN